MPIGAAQAALGVASRTAAEAMAREPTQTAPLRATGAAPPFLTVSVLFDDYAPGEVDRQRAAADRAHVPSEFGSPRRLSLESGICDPAQRAAGRSTRWVAEAGESESGRRTEEFCQWHFPGLCRRLRGLLSA